MSRFLRFAVDLNHLHFPCLARCLLNSAARLHPESHLYLQPLRALNPLTKPPHQHSEKNSRPQSDLLDPQQRPQDAARIEYLNLRLPMASEGHPQLRSRLSILLFALPCHVAPPHSLRSRFVALKRRHAVVYGGTATPDSAVVPRVGPGASPVGGLFPFLH